MATSDGITYYLNNLPMSAGRVKFRQDDNPDIAWGGIDFPSGKASLGGPAIPVVPGTYTVKFNIVTGEYSFNFPSIGLLGDALPGWWYEDVDMTTTDGIIYTLIDYPFSSGEVKFRQDNEWYINWGGYSFPSGWGFQGGPNIPVPQGTYNVTFNRLTGEYNFVATSCPFAAIQCPDYVYTASTPGMCGAEVFYPPVAPAANCGGPGVEITQIGGLPSGSFFPVGVTTNTFMLTNQEGGTAYCGFEVYVGDYEPPVIEGLSGDFQPLWPANHRMVMVPIEYYASDNCGNTYSELYVYSTEPDNGLGDGDTSPDWKIIDEHNVLLRAERSALGTGREYHIIIVCHDDFWNYSFSEVIVSVPHDMDNKSSEPLPFKYNVWPNPSSGIFTLQVESDSDGMIEVSVSDINGRTVSQILIMNMQTINFGEICCRVLIYFISSRVIIQELSD